MVSNEKNSRYNSDSTTEDDGDMDYIPNNQPKKSGRKPTRTPKCFSKNALMARENRRRKKQYIADLEGQVSALKTENKKLSSIVENQSFMINELKKEAKYLKSVIANSEGIGKLIRAINSTTGMPVSSSISKQLANSRNHNNKSPVVTQLVPELSQWVQKHPWEERSNAYANYPTPDSSNSYYSNPDFDELNNEGLLLDLDLPLEMNNEELLDMIDEKALESPMLPMADHNYHNPVKYEQDSSNNADDVGVCLHVSNNNVSLEFCPTCSENASQNWKAT